MLLEWRALESTGVFYNFPIQSFLHISPEPSIPEHITHPKYSQTYKHIQLNIQNIIQSFTDMPEENVKIICLTRDSKSMFYLGETFWKKSCIQNIL